MSKKKIIPELRFSEFVNDGEWEEKTIDSIGSVITGGTPSKKENGYWGGDFVWITAQDFKEKYINNSVLKLTQKGKKKSRVIPKNSVLVTCIASIGLNGINKVECATNQQINSIVCNSENYFEFIYYAISHNINRLKRLAGQNVVPIINKSVFEKFIIQKPKNPKEQQKIADCLSSLDEVISDNIQKLKLLKDHKNGLMQNLFPQEGETVPKLRFPEFVNAGEWEEKRLDEIFNSFSGGTPSTSKKEYYGGNISFIRSAEINKEETALFITEEGLRNSSAKLVYKGDLLVALYGANSGDSAISKINGAINQAILCLQSEYSNAFTYHFLTLKKDWVVSKFIQGGQGNLSGDIIKSIKIRFPKKDEQQKIADCLSSLDAVIKGQTEKTEQLKWYKKGLMQCLFPEAV